MINFMLGCLNVIDLQNTVISAKVNGTHGKYRTELKRLSFPIMHDVGKIGILYNF